MEFRKLGNSGVEVSVFSLGSWLTYEFMNEKDALTVMSRGLESGINFLDDARYDDRTGTAPMKSGYSEVVFGRLLRKGGWNRADLVIANKFWLEFYPEQSLEEELDGSLSRLKIDYIDLVYCAPPPASLSVVELVKQMDDLIKTGKVRYWGVMLDWPAQKMEEAYQVAIAEGMSPPCTAQLAYSLLNTSPVEDEQTKKVCSTAGIGIVASYTLYGGLLSGKYNQPDVIESRFGKEEVESMRQKGLLNKVDRVVSLAQELDCTPAQLALAYCLKNDQVSSLLFGATKVSQIEENIQTLAILPHIDQEVMAKLRSI